MRIVDLTRTISTGMPVYPGDPEVGLETCIEYSDHGFRVAGLRLGTHAGTHVDAPAHFFPGGETVDQLSLVKLMGPALLIDLDASPAAFQPGERVLIRSGWARHWGSADYFTEFPPFPARLAEQLVAAPVALVGLETPTLHPDGEEDARLHRLLLGRGVVLVENLVNLDELPERVSLTVLPLPFLGLDGSPCRAVATFEESSSEGYGQVPAGRGGTSPH